MVRSLTFVMNRLIKYYIIDPHVLLNLSVMPYYMTLQKIALMFG